MSTSMQSRIQHEVKDAFETYGYPGQGPLVITCEHASNRIPAPLRSNKGDGPWLKSHWGWDIGVRTVTREMVRQTGSFSVLARFSRLVCDPNRPPNHRYSIRQETEGWMLSFNRELGDDEVKRRLDRYYHPYHQAVDRAIRERTERPDAGDVLLLSVHSFTPIWNGRIRPMDVGILFRDYEPIARRLAGELRKEGVEPALNEPYSALDGLSYAVERHGKAHGLVYMELELNQSLVCTPARARKVARKLANAVGRLHIRSKSR